MEDTSPKVDFSSEIEEFDFNSDDAIISRESANFSSRQTGYSILKDKLYDFYKRLRYFYFCDNSLSYYYWTCIVTIGILYNMFAQVIFIFDDVFLGYFNYWLIFNIFFDIIFILDITVQMRLTFMHDGQEVRNTTKLFTHYRENRRRVIMDIICMLPTDIVLFYNPSLSLVRSVRMLKGHRLLDFINMTMKRAILPYGFRIVVLVTFCVILFHWNACVYFLFSLSEGLSEDDTSAFGFSYYKVFDPIFPACEAFYDENCWYEENEEKVLDLDDERPKYMREMYQYWSSRYYKLELGNFSREYSMSMYWSSLTITTCGQQPWPSTSAQNALEVFDTLIGVLVFATIIGSVGSVITQMNETVHAFRQLMDGIKFYMKYRQVNSRLNEKVTECFMYLNNNNQLDDEKSRLALLPPRLQNNIAASLHTKTLESVELLKGCDQRFMYEVVTLVKQQVYSPDDYLCRKRDNAREMFIVKRGLVSVIDEDSGVVLEQLVDGATFGELSIIHVDGSLLGEKRSVSVRSVGYSDVFILYKEDVAVLLKEFPEERARLVGNAREMLHRRGLLLLSPLDEMIMIDKDDIEEDETLLECLSIDEQLQRIAKIVKIVDDELAHMVTSFAYSSVYYKQRLTNLETKFNENRELIWQDCMRGVL